MAFSQIFTAARATAPHWPSVLTTLRQTDASIGGGPTIDPFTATFDKDTAWTAQQISQTQTVITNAPADTPEIEAQFSVDGMPIATKALLLTLLDQINTIRAALSPPLGAITPAQALAAVRAKAGTL
jgi:hypothetical protein